MAEVKEKKTNTKIDITKKEPIDKEKKKTVSNNKVDKKKDKKTTTKSIKDKKKIFEKDAIKTTVEKMKKYNVTAIVMIALSVFIFSFIISAQLNTVGNTDIISKGMREAELLIELQKSKEEYEALKEKYEENQKVVEEYKTNSSSNDTLIASMKTELENANILAGIAKVKGEGVVVTLEDSTDTTLSQEAGLVHDTDLISVVSELKSAGAEAISINGQRVIATTAIRCVGPTIQVNSTKVASPFYIKAIGNAKYLESALNIKNGVVSSLKSYGIKVDVETDKSITIDKYDATLKFGYATIVK